MLGDLLVNAGHAFLWGGGDFVPLFGLFLFLQFFHSLGRLLAGDWLRAGLFADSWQDVVFAVLVIGSSFIIGLSFVFVFDPDHFLVFPFIALFSESFDFVFKFEENFFDVLIVDIIFDLLSLSFFKEVEQLIDVFLLVLFGLLLGMGPGGFGFFLVGVGLWGGLFWFLGGFTLGLGFGPDVGGGVGAVGDFFDFLSALLS